MGIYAQFRGIGSICPVGGGGAWGQTDTHAQIQNISRTACLILCGVSMNTTTLCPVSACTCCRSTFMLRKVTYLVQLAETILQAVHVVLRLLALAQKHVLVQLDEFQERLRSCIVASPIRLHVLCARMSVCVYVCVCVCVYTCGAILEVHAHCLNPSPPLPMASSTFPK